MATKLPIVDVNISLASSNGKVAFKSTNAKGLAVFDNIISKDTLIISAYMVGYKDYVSPKIFSSTTFSVFMEIAVDSLDEIVLDFKRPMRIVEDTITYNTNAYTSGNEFKLKELLRKLPGIEVDRSGNVTSNGRNINRLLVDGKTFFIGDEKLGVNNIPANAVDQIQILDNYSEVALLKEFENTEELVMNVKLKEDKKSFIFGDLSASGGLTNRYVLNPALFYYSPDYAVNAILEFNNTGDKSFTLRDYIDFNGGILNISPSTYFKLTGDSFAKFLVNRDFVDSKNKFYAGSYRKSWEHTDISAYVIYNNASLNTKSTAVNQFLGASSFIEEREENSISDSAFLLSKIDFVYKPNNSLDARISTTIKTSTAVNSGNSMSQIPQQITLLSADYNLNSYEGDVDFIITKKTSLRHVFSTQFGFNHSRTTPTYLWSTNRPQLSDIIPFVTDHSFIIQQNTNTTNKDFNGTIKHYFKYLDDNNLQSSISFFSSNNNLQTITAQLVSNGMVNSFEVAGFNNDVEYNVLRAISGLKHNHEANKFEFSESVFLQYNSVNSGGNETTSYYIIPQFRATYKRSEAEQLSFNYNRNVSVPTLTQVANRFYLASFNNIAIGSQNLNDRVLDRFTFNYRKFDLFKGLQINGSLSYTNRTQGPKTISELDGIDQVSSFVPFDLNEKNVNGYIDGSKVIGNFKFGLNVSYNKGFFYQLLSGELTRNDSQNTRLGASFKTLSEKFPALELRFFRDYNTYEGVGSISRFTNDIASINIDYEFAKHFVFTASTSLNFYKNKDLGQQNTFNSSFASLNYLREDSRWSYKLSGSNLWNNAFRQSNSFSDFLIIDQQEFIQPRIIIVGVTYKL